MTSIPVAICRFSDQKLKLLYLKKKRLFLIFYCISECAWNLQLSEKKEKYPSLIITEIIASERDIYLSV